MSDFVTRLGSELDAASARQVRRRRLRWPASRSGRLLAVGGALVAFAGAGGAATGLIPLPGEVGGPPTMVYTRLTPEQRAAGLEERTRPVVIGRGQLPDAGWRWQLIAFQTTRGLCIAVDVPAYANVGGGCGSDRPRERRAVDWQGYLSRLGRRTPAMVLGAVDPAAKRVTVAGTEARRARGEDRRRVKRTAQIVLVDDPRVLAAIGVARPFAYYVGETAGSNPSAVVAAFDGSGRLLGRAGVPNGGAGSAGFLPQRGCEVDEPFERPVELVTLPLPAAAREAFAVLRRPQRASDRPAWLLRRIMGERQPLLGHSEIDADTLRRLPGARERYLVAARAGAVSQLPDGCLRTTTPRLRAIERRGETSARRWAAVVWLMVVDRAGRPLASIRADAPWERRMFAIRGLPGHRSVIGGIVPDGVASVTIRYRDGATASARVVDNAYAVELPVGVGGVRRVRQVWRDADGRVVRRR